MNNDVDILIAVLNTMDEISISGRKNIENFRNCVIVLEKLVASMNERNANNVDA